MGRKLDSLTDGLIREISEDIFELNKEVVNARESVEGYHKATLQSIEYAQKEFTNFLVKSVDDLDEHIAQRKKQSDEDIRQAFSDNCNVAVKEFSEKITAVSQKAENRVLSLAESLDEIETRCKTIESYAGNNKMPKWAKILFATMTILTLVSICTAFLVGMYL
ncbi:hypothetical protein [Kushneria indalinina]|uniref:Uncharacterized protein n=1 Tax=Kushneria indalinina DSM 14324 TaxID=1122140 RepID=A0A3D9DSD9_9GAMM|nr:hypothetical protein [Kushneria indalinina]REC93319.1 hypothetical protein C8D72_3477 [Kushneria indalinina DSM 14324]